MRSALICVLLALLIKEGHVADDFRPTPIPLDEWRPDENRGRAGTLHKTAQTEFPSTVVAVPAHYWEDALRHSVYLTLVRDKIDQLIAKGEVIAPDSKHNDQFSKDVDDQDLWDTIKAAPFDRIKEEEPTTYGDVTILAKGRLLEESEGYRFAEDDKSREKCDNDKCMEGVKAFWTVKRVRQRDQETSPGRYHYELTFSVMSQIPKQQKRPYEHPIRTFTVQESPNDRVTDPPRAYHKAETYPPHISRPERAVWFHKNIAQIPNFRKRQPSSGLDRLFSSLFEYDDDELNYEPKRYKQGSYHPSISQYSKVGYVGSSSSENTQIKPYPYKPNSVKYQNYPLTTTPKGPIQHHYFEQDISDGISNSHISQADYIPAGYNNVQRTTRPAVLPTPLPPLSTSKESHLKKGNAMKYDMFENVKYPLEDPVYNKQYDKMKTPPKLSYFPDHLRPPIYNAPPGVFVTMDKKPFKPMPPLKMPGTKPLRANKPIDFRPSPQVLDVQFSEPDLLFDTVFRPITINYVDNSDSTEKTLIDFDNDKSENKIQKPIVSVKKPQKKQNIEKSQSLTTNTPDIITAHNNPEQDDVMEWVDMLGIFSKTTPMESQKEKTKISQTTTSLPISTVTTPIVTRQMSPETSSTMTTSTLKPKKHTRPPPKFNKTVKIKKHKRITTTLTPITTADTPLAPKKSEEGKTKISDQNHQSSTTKSHWKPSVKSTSTTPFSTIGTSANPSSATKLITTSRTVENEPITSTARPKNINRYRQSTLIIKGTSVKHDKWSVTSSAPEKLRGASIYTQRRKGSNFHGYVSSTPKILDEERKRHDHIDHGISTILSTSPETEIINKTTEVESTTTPASKETGETVVDSEDKSALGEGKHEENYEESRDHSEYIFQQASDTTNDKNNEIIDSEETFTTEKVIGTSSHTIPKAKKCKKKLRNNRKNEDAKKNLDTSNPTSTQAPTTPTALTTADMLEDLLNDFSFDDNDSEHILTTSSNLDLDKEPSQSHKQYFEMNDDLEELLDSLNNDKKYEELSDKEYENDDDDDYNDDEDNDDDNDGGDDNEKEPIFEEEDTSYHSADYSPRHTNNDGDENRPFTLLELMAME